MTNVLERAKAIRMSGEPWQNAVQRATSQVRYETAMGGAKTTRKSSSGRKSSGQAAKKKANRTKAAKVARLAAPVRKASPLKGKKLSATHRAKISAGRRGVHHSTDACRYNEKTQHCRLSTRGRQSPQYRPNNVTSQGLLDHREEFAERASQHKGKSDFKSSMAARYGQAGGARRRSSKKKPRKLVRTDNCYQARNEPGRCRLSTHGRKLHNDFKTSQEQAEVQSRFVAASAAARGLPKGQYGERFREVFHEEGNAPARASTRAPARAAAPARGRDSATAKKTRAARASKKAYQASADSTADQEAAMWESGRGHSSKKGARQLRTGGGRSDGFSDTSSTRSSDFTSVSDTTSYTMSAQSQDTSSLW